MAYRRRHGLTKASTFMEEIYHPNNEDHLNQTQKDDDEDGNDNGHGNKDGLLDTHVTHRDSPIEESTIAEQKATNITQETCDNTIDILQETSNLQFRRRGCSSDNQDQATVLQNSSWQRPAMQPVRTHLLLNGQTQLKASRDVAMATAAKAKVLLRELKTVKADLAFAKQRCAQLEEENKRLLERREKGNNPDDDDLVRLQLETLLAEKARLTHENAVYARENQFLREIVEYHQLTMQDIIHLDEGTEEDTEIYPFSIEDATPLSPISPFYPLEVASFSFPLEMKQCTVEVSKEPSHTTTS